MNKTVIAAVVAISTALVTAPAVAHKGEGHRHDKDRSEMVEKGRGKHRKEISNKRVHQKLHRKEHKKAHRKAHKKAERHAHKHHGDKHWKHRKHGKHAHSHWHNGVKHHHKHKIGSKHHGHGRHSHNPTYYYSYSDNDWEELMAGLLIGGVIGYALSENNVWEH